MGILVKKRRKDGGTGRGAEFLDGGGFGTLKFG